LIEGLQYFAALEDDRNSLYRLIESQNKLIVTYMNKNQDLWLALAKFPGGLDEARRLGRPTL
jgi:hypothetical protein